MVDSYAVVIDFQQSEKSKTEHINREFLSCDWEVFGDRAVLVSIPHAGNFTILH